MNLGDFRKLTDTLSDDVVLRFVHPDWGVDRAIDFDDIKITGSEVFDQPEVLITPPRYELYDNY
jgi:hypothetical protein